MDDMSVEGLGLCPASGTSDWIKGQPSGWVPLKLPAAGRGAVAGVEATTPCPRHAMGKKVPRDFSFFSAPRCFLQRPRLAPPASSCPLRAPPPLCSCHLSHQTAPTVLPPSCRLLCPPRHLFPCEPWLRHCPPAPCPCHPNPRHQLPPSPAAGNFTPASHVIRGSRQRITCVVQRITSLNQIGDVLRHIGDVIRGIGAQGDVIRVVGDVIRGPPTRNT